MLIIMSNSQRCELKSHDLKFSFWSQKHKDLWLFKNKRDLQPDFDTTDWWIHLDLTVLT